MAVLAISVVIGPRDSTPVKRSTYESGLVPVGPGRRRVPIRFYLIATLFILFDIEIVYLYPWAVQLRDLAQPPPAGVGLAALASMGLFIGVLWVGLLYVWRKGALDWK